MISEEDRKRIEKDAIDFIEHIPYLMNKSEVQLGYRHGAKRELILSQSRESSLKEEIWNEACAAQFKNLALISFPPEIISIMEKQPIPINPYLSSKEETEPLSAAKRLIKKYHAERDEARGIIQELEQQNKELREALRIMHAIAYHLQDSMQLFGKLSAVVPPDIEAKIKLAGEKSELLGKEAAMFDFEKLLKQ